jgi:hypothetical protein
LILRLLLAAFFIFLILCAFSFIGGTTKDTSYFGMLFVIFLPLALGLWLVISGFLIWGYFKWKLADKT